MEQTPLFRFEINSGEKVILLPEKTSAGSQVCPKVMSRCISRCLGIESMYGVCVCVCEEVDLYDKDENRRVLFFLKKEK